jgi:hypothetical protein
VRKKGLHFEKKIKKNPKYSEKDRPEKKEASN